MLGPVRRRRRRAARRARAAAIYFRLITDLSLVAQHFPAVDVRGWLVSDYAGSNPVFAHLLDERLFLTRRAFLLITEDACRLLISRVDAVADLAISSHCVVETYTSWMELQAWLDTHVAPLGTVAMEYSPSGDLPAMSWVDGGTLDLVRDRGVVVRSSADLFQVAVGEWSERDLHSHRTAMAHAAEVKDLAFAFVAQQLRAGERCTELDVQAFILAEFERRRLTTNEKPIVAVNGHSGDPHYEPTPERNAELRRGDWLLIDLWCREQQDDAVFADITWVGYLGPSVPDEHKRVFDIVAGARDAVVDALRDRFDRGQTVRGYELDNIARRQITSAGFGENFVHRTGHSLGSRGLLHGLTANLDDLETHDTRPILTSTGFTIEPGVYLPAFGVRTEINVYMTQRGPEITSPVQAAPIVLSLG
jgi:Xaa-Pro dipeptidase